MTDTTRNLIQRLVDIADTLDGRKPLVFSQGQAMDGFTALANFQSLANEARAYLAQPEPEGPTDEELVAVLKQAIKDFPPNHPDAKALDSLEYEIEIELRKARAVLARWSRPVIEPVPVSERLPGPEDCMDEGWAWFYTPRGDWIKAVLPVSPAYTHWLPHYALPVPTFTETP